MKKDPRLTAESREAFLRRYILTAGIAFEDCYLDYKSEPAQKLIELARATFGFNQEIQDRKIYRVLRERWKSMCRRKAGPYSTPYGMRYHGNLDMLPIDREEKF